jgi:hypothetical protein
MSSMTVLRPCRRCLTHDFQQLRFSTSVTSSPKPVPLRIFSTEADAEEEYHHDVKREKSKAEKQKAFLEWKNNRSFPGAPTLNEFRERAGGRLQARGLLLENLARPVPTDPLQRTTMLSRMRSTSDPESRNFIHPAELLQTPDASEADEIIFAAIETCISGAIDRLELYGNTGSASRPAKSIRIPHDQYLWLCHILDFQFVKEQIVMYAHRCGKRNNLPRKKDDLIKTILDEIWNFKKEAELPPDEALVTKSSITTSFWLILGIPITRRERFFMIGEGIFPWKRFTDTASRWWRYPLEMGVPLSGANRSRSK